MGVLVSVWTCSSVARAEERAPLPAEVTSPPASPPKDIVRLRSGGIVRGTIVESVPGDAVKIQLVTGEVRMIPYGETTYAGPDVPPVPVATHVEYAPPPRASARHMRSPGALVGGIAAVVLGQLGLAVTVFGLAEESRCEFQRDSEFRRDSAFRRDSEFPGTSRTTDCTQGGLVAGGLVAFLALTAGGVGLIVYGAKRVPSTDTAVRFVPWTQGTNGGGGSLQLRF